MARDIAPLAALELALEDLVPSGVAYAVEDPGAPEGEGDLFAVEAAAMARAVPKRRAEFAAGRRAAHRAMADLGLLPEPVPMGPDRAPEWPEGLAGSISHCAGAAVAILGYAGVQASLGVDVEPDLPLPDELYEVVCSEDERARLAAHDDAARMRAARMIFSAKECAYKLQAPLSGKLLDFSDLDVVLELDHGGFEVRFLCQAGPYVAGEVLHGGIALVAGFILCVMSDAQEVEII